MNTCMIVLIRNLIYFFLTSQIVLALFHVHSKNILHRDLKSQNIFIAEGMDLMMHAWGREG